VATEFSCRPKDAARALAPEDVAHVVAMLATQRAQSVVSEVEVRPLGKGSGEGKNFLLTVFVATTIFAS
jgi:hypothetical protein